MYLNRYLEKVLKINIRELVLYFNNPYDNQLILARKNNTYYDKII
jgi:hypothetical protein